QLQASSTALWIDQGRLSIELRVQPKGGWQDYGTVRLWTLDASHFAELNAVTGVITVTINGVSNTSNPSPIWTRLDTLHLYIAAGGGLPTQIAWMGNNGATWQAVITGSTLGTVPTLTPTLLGKDQAQQWSSYVQQVTAWRKGEVPAWLQ
ncbi:MAG: hypothetical protein Q8Q09_07960, partial [Deltaproteobacteria bacterium]|nr:hypothetical protein [Deltaproteobacteria bacterium]